MNKDYGDLVEYLDGKFIKIDKRFDLADRKFDNIDQRLEEIAEQKDFDKPKEKVRNLVNSIDKLTRSIEIYHDKQKAISFKIDQHEKWIQQMAEKIGMKLNQ